MHWIAWQFCVCINLDFRAKIYKCKWIPLAKFRWIPRTNTCNVILVGTIFLLWILQRASIGSGSGFRKSTLIPQMQVDSANLCAFREQFTESAFNLRIPLTICSFGFHDNLNLLTFMGSWQLKFIFIRSRVPQTVLIPHIYLWILQSCPFLGRFWAKQCFCYFSLELKKVD